MGVSYAVSCPSCVVAVPGKEGPGLLGVGEADSVAWNCPVIMVTTGGALGGTVSQIVSKDSSHNVYIVHFLTTCT